MCGFFGCIDGDVEVASRMANLVHRGPDSTNDYRDGNLTIEEIKLSLKENDLRLQIIDEKSCDR